MKERMNNPEKNRDIAHDSTFDKVLAEYFLQKRQDVKGSNTLLKQMTEQFGKEGRHPGVQTAETNGRKTLGEHYNRQTWEKEDKPVLPSYKLPDLMELDMTVNRHLHGNMSALSAQLREGKDLASTEIPEYFDANDVRKPADKFVQDALRGIMDELFASRQQLEKYMSRQELLAYDNILSNFLTYE